MAEEQVVLEFVGSEQGLDEVAAKMNKVLGITEEQAKAMLKSGQATVKSVTQTTSSVDKLSKSFKDLTTGISGGAIKTGVDNLNKLGQQTVKATEGTVRLTTQLRNLRNELATLDEGSKRFQELSIQAAKLEDRIGDVNQRVRNLASDTKNLDAFVSIAQGIAGGFAAAQGAAALFGDENENLQKALLKVQGAMALLVGLQQLQQTILTESAAKTFIVTNAQKIYTFVTEGATLATRTFNAALVATVGGAILVGIGLLIANWEKLAKAIGLAKDEQDGFGQATKESLERQIKLQEALGEETYQLRKKQLENEIDLILGNNKQKEKLTQEELNKIKDFNNQLAILEIEHEDFIAKKKLNSRISLDKAIVDQFKEGTKERLQAEINLLNAERDLAVANAKGNQTEVLRIELDTINKIKKLREDAFRPKATGAIEPITPKAIGNIKEIRKEIQAIPEDLKRTQAAQEQLNKSIEEENRLREANRKKIITIAIESAQEVASAVFEIEENNRQARVDAELAALDKQREAALANKDLTENQKAAIDAKFEAKERAIKLKAFKADKKAAIAQALINGALAITNVLANMRDPTIVQAFKIAAIAANAVAIATQVAVIAAQKPPAFKKGTKSAPGGMALVGEEGAELMHVPQGARIIPHSETMKVLSGHPDTEEILSRFNIPVTSAKVENLKGKFSDFDYQKFESIIARHAKSTSFNIDKEGIFTIVKNEMDSRTYYGKRYSSR